MYTHIYNTHNKCTPLPFPMHSDAAAHTHTVAPDQTSDGQTKEVFLFVLPGGTAAAGDEAGQSESHPTASSSGSGEYGVLWW